MSDDEPAPSALWVSIEFESDGELITEALRAEDLDDVRDGLRVYLVTLTKWQARALATGRAAVQVPYMPARSSIKFRLQQRGEG